LGGYSRFVDGPVFSGRWALGYGAVEMTQGQYSAEQQELISLLQSELSDMLDFDFSALYSEAIADRLQVLDDVHLHLANLSNAAKLVGLAGLEQGCKQVLINFTWWQERQWVDAAWQPLMAGWCPLLLHYLNTYGSDEEASAVELFLAYLQDGQWPLAADDGQVQSLREAFAASVVVVEDALNTASLPDYVDEDLVSLAIDADVNRDLLAGLLQELPDQSQSFARAIERLVREQDSAALPVAQRAAHTLKGAANLVGIRGLANLMHYAEDLLDLTAKHGMNLSPLLRDLLEDLADCLASMSEYLLGLGPKPQQSVEVLTRLLDVLRQAQTGGWEVLAVAPVEPDYSLGAQAELLEASAEGVAQSRAMPVQTAPAPAPTSQTATPAAPADDEETQRHHLNVPDTLAQELLRLAGENQISTNQVLTRITALMTGVRSASQYHQKIRQIAGEFDQSVQLQGIKNAAAGHRLQEGDLDPLELERYNELHSFASQLQEVTTDAQEAIYYVESQLKELSNLVIEQRQRSAEAQGLLLQIRMLPVALIAPRLARCVRQAARLTHKSVRLEISGEDVLVDSRVLNAVVDPLMHLLRNAVDHGIESPQQREAGHKFAEGLIQLVFSRQGESLQIVVQDDGAGFDYARIEELARERGFLEPYENASRSELHKIILTPGFSTRQQVSQTSGRGIGLDVVHTQVRGLKGGMQMQSEEGQGSRFVLSMPMSILSAHTLVVKLGQHKFSLVSRGVLQIIYLQSQDIDWHVPTPQFSWAGGTVDVLRLDDIAMVPGVQRPERYSALVLVNRGESGQVAVALEAVLASEEQIIKPLNKYACKPAGVVGAAILGDGSVSAVLDLQDFPTLQMTQVEYQRWLRTKADLQARFIPPAAKPIALVVDDSLSARRALAQFMEDLGLEVVTAKDGFEAISVMQNTRPSLLLVDLEMPRMNGLELTSHIRAAETQTRLPIVMVTSRITDKHRQMASQAGVDAYLNKPWSEDELMQVVQAFLPVLA
jgi:chemotaxis protein histidine kinase CheA